ncbi:MAG: tetratricopeptide repeat protein [Bacteroidetes bacterium]|nr:tetratricopeptide repeat protein [Bacteroidota bacterium]
MARFISLPPSIDKKTFKNCIFLFCVLTFLIYGKSIGNGYSMDDEYVIHNNKQVHGGIAKIPEIFRSTYALEEKASFEYRPLVKVTYAIEYQFFGESPHLSHFLNILMYILCLVLLFYVLLRLLPAYHYLFALTVVLLFLIHPLHSEVVISLKNRDVMMSFIGCMCSLMFYLRYTEGKGKPFVNLALGFFFLLLAIMSKKDAITFFAIIPFSMWFFRDAGWKKIRWILLTYLPVIISFRLAARSVMNTSVRTLLLWENPLFIHSTLPERIPQGFYSLYFYLKMFLFPHPLIAYYGYNQVPIVSWGNAVVWIMILLLIGLAYLIVKRKAVKELWAYGIIYFLVTISMFTNVLVPVVGIVGERFAYIPSVGLCIVAAYFLLKYFKVPLQNIAFRLKSLNNGYWITIALLAVLYGGKSFSRNADWKDAYTLYHTDVETGSESAHTHSLLAATALARVKAEPRLSKAEKKRLVLEAEEHYLEAIRIIPDYTSSHNNIGMLYYTYLGDNEKATKHLERAVELDSNYVEAYFNLGSCYAAAQKYDLAEKCYLRSLKLNPKFTTAYQALSNMYGMQKKFDKILRLNQEAIDKGIKSDVMYVNIGNVYFMNGDTVKALPYLEKAIQYNSNNRGVNAFLANWYQARGDKQKSAYYYGLMSRSSR